MEAQNLSLSVTKILVPVPPGGTSDFVARSLAAQLVKALGHPVVVENKPGATGQIAVDVLRQAKPDGGTLLLAPIALPVLGPLVNPRHSYDLVPIAQVGTYSFAVAVRVDHPARNMRELTAWVNANPKRANFGTAATASMPHFIGLMLANITGVKWEHVPYRGISDAQKEVINGDLAVAIGATSDLIALHQAGKLRVVATTGSTRAPLLDAVPTLREQGIAIEVAGWTGLFAPEGTPRAVIDAVSAATNNALKAPEVRASFRAAGIEPVGTTPDALAAIIEVEKRRWAPVVRASGFTPE